MDVREGLYKGAGGDRVIRNEYDEYMSELIRLSRRRAAAMMQSGFQGLVFWEPKSSRNASGSFLTRKFHHVHYSTKEQGSHSILLFRDEDSGESPHSGSAVQGVSQQPAWEFMINKKHIVGGKFLLSSIVCSRLWWLWC